MTTWRDLSSCRILWPAPEVEPLDPTLAQQEIDELYELGELDDIDVDYEKDLFRWAMLQEGLKVAVKNGRVKEFLDNLKKGSP
jgi:hypothetical protein